MNYRNIFLSVLMLLFIGCVPSMFAMEQDLDARELIEEPKVEIPEFVWDVVIGNLSAFKKKLNNYSQQEIQLDLNHVHKLPNIQGTLLHLASSTGHVKIIKFLLKKGIPIDVKNSKGETPLHFACSAGHEKVVKFLLEQKAGKEALTNKKLTPLHYACQHGHDDIVEILVEKGANIETLDEINRTPLHRACYYGKSKIVELLIKKGADLGALDKYGNNLLHVACSNDKSKTVKLLLTTKNISNTIVNSKNNKNFTPLHIACEYNSFDIVKNLIGFGASVNAVAENNVPPLHYVCQNKNLEMAQFLIQEGASVSLSTEFGDTPLHVACKFGSYTIAELLIEKLSKEMGCANILRERGGAGYTPLHYACRYGYPNIAKLLLDNGADLNQKTNKGKNPAQVAKAAKHYALANFLEALLQKNPENSYGYIDDVCPVCQGNFKTDQLCTKLGCGHVYHFDCLDPWEKTKKECPLDRLKIEDKEIGGKTIFIFRKPLQESEVDVITQKESSKNHQTGGL